MDTENGNIPPTQDAPPAQEDIPEFLEIDDSWIPFDLQDNLLWPDDRPEIEALSDDEPLLPPPEAPEPPYAAWAEELPVLSEQRIWEAGKLNFVEKFIALQGDTPIPRIYLRFVALSLLSAVAQNKVWVELSPRNPLFPNLYIFLVGQSGSGKGRAMKAGLQLLESCGLQDYVGILGGTFTAAALIDFLASKWGKGVGDTTRSYVVTPEFASSIKWGEQADALVKTMTDLFTADLSVYTDATRGGGVKRVGRPCVSWIAGSTRDWLVSNLNANAIGGGFMARCLFVESFQRLPLTFAPDPPPNEAELWAALQLQLVDRIQRAQGRLIIEPKGLAYLREWHERRDVPRSDEALASWNRHLELSLKVATLLSLGDPAQGTSGSDPGSITEFHLYEAVSLVEEIKSTESMLWSFIFKKGKIHDIDYVAGKIKQAKEIDHSALLTRVASGRGILARRFTEIIETLRAAKKIEVTRQDRKDATNGKALGKLVYRWLPESRPNLISTNVEEDVMG